MKKFNEFITEEVIENNKDAAKALKAKECTVIIENPKIFGGENILYIEIDDNTWYAKGI